MAHFVECTSGLLWCSLDWEKKLRIRSNLAIFQQGDYAKLVRLLYKFYFLTIKLQLGNLLLQNALAYSSGQQSRQIGNWKIGLLQFWAADIISFETRWVEKADRSRNWLKKSFKFWVHLKSLLRTSCWFFFRKMTLVKILTILSLVFLGAASSHAEELDPSSDLKNETVQMKLQYLEERIHSLEQPGIKIQL